MKHWNSAVCFNQWPILRTIVRIRWQLSASVEDSADGQSSVYPRKLQTANRADVWLQKSEIHRGRGLVQESEKKNCGICCGKYFLRESERGKQSLLCRSGVKVGRLATCKSPIMMVHKIKLTKPGQRQRKTNRMTAPEGNLIPEWLSIGTSPKEQKKKTGWPRAGSDSGGKTGCKKWQKGSRPSKKAFEWNKRKKWRRQPSTVGSTVRTTNETSSLSKFSTWDFLLVSVVYFLDFLAFYFFTGLD